MHQSQYDKVSKDTIKLKESNRMSLSELTLVLAIAKGLCWCYKTINVTDSWLHGTWQNLQEDSSDCSVPSFAPWTKWKSSPVIISRESVPKEERFIFILERPIVSADPIGFQSIKTVQ